MCTFRSPPALNIPSLSVCFACRDWFQLTLKEGLTVFRDQLFSGDMGSHAVKRIEVQFAYFINPRGILEGRGVQEARPRV